MHILNPSELTLTGQEEGEEKQDSLFSDFAFCHSMLLTLPPWYLYFCSKLEVYRGENRLGGLKTWDWAPAMLFPSWGHYEEHLPLIL